VLTIPLTLAALLTMAERKTSAYIQLRFGPNRVGPRGCCSRWRIPEAVLSENVSPSRADQFLGRHRDVHTGGFDLMIVPFAPNAVVTNLNRHPVLCLDHLDQRPRGHHGGLREPVELRALRGRREISYEVPLILSLLGVIILTALVAGRCGERAGTHFGRGNVWFQLPMFVVFYMRACGGKGSRSICPRARRDVGGFMVEYSG